MKKTNAIRLLDSNNISYQLVEYAYDAKQLNVEILAKKNNLEVHRVFKTLVAKGNKTGVIIAVIPGNKSLNFKALAKVSANKKLTLIAVKEIQRLTGYIRGGCSPLGMKKNYPIFLDESALELDKIYVNAGIRGLLVGLKAKDLQKLTQAEMAAIAT